jgi:hypothetical protein
LKKREDLDFFFLVRVVLSVCGGDEVRTWGWVSGGKGFVSGIMFNYKISSASQAIFLASTCTDFFFN